MAKQQRKTKKVPVKPVAKKPTDAGSRKISPERAARFVWEPDDIVFDDPEVQKAWEAAGKADSGEQAAKHRGEREKRVEPGQIASSNELER